MKDFLKYLKTLKKRIESNKLFVFLGLVLTLFALLAVLDVFLREDLTSKKVLPSPIKNVSISSYPTFQTQFNPDVTAQAAVVLDDGSKTLLFAKNENLRFSTASTAKIMTALVALDYYKPQDVLTIYTDDVEPVVVGFKKGEQLFFKDILYAMLVPSGNDAALAIAENYPGGEKAFILQMNKKARSLNLSNTRFADSSGLSDNDYSTALDLARLTSIALKNPTFSEVVATQQKTIWDITGKNKYNLLSLNKLLGQNGVNGVKTGYTQEAGGVLITSKIENGKRIIIVVMKSQDRFLDMREIISKIQDKLIFLPASPSQGGPIHP